MAQKVLLVEPNFPTKQRSNNHHNPLPLGLLKLASYHRSLGNSVQLIHGCTNIDYYPDEILITSIFTYWSKYVWGTVSYYKSRFPKAHIVVGGIYASLMPEHCKQSGCDEVHVGIHEQAEKFMPAYDLVEFRFPNNPNNARVYTDL